MFGDHKGYHQADQFVRGSGFDRDSHLERINSMTMHSVYDKNRQIVPSHHNKPLYVTAHICDVELRRAMTDLGSSLNIMLLFTLEMVSIPHEDHQAAYRGFRFLSASFTVGYINLNLTIGPLQAAIKLYVIDTRTSYHLFHGRTWIHKHQHVPSMYHQCLKKIWKGKKVHVRASECSFQQDGAHFPDVTFFYELAED